MHSLSGNGFDGLYASECLRYQASSTLGYGGSLNLRNAVDTSHSAQLFRDKQTAWGQTRVQVDQASSQGRSDSWQVGLDQAFPLQQGTRLSASLSYGSLRYDDMTGNGSDATRTTTLALYGGRDLTDRLSIRSEEHTSELQSLMRISYAVFCLKKHNQNQHDSNQPSTLTSTPNIII